jgi:radical SAM protein with 4Fe4S-binding SPASM domain
MSTHIAVEKLMGWSYSGLKDFTLGTNPDTYDGLPLVPKDICAYPFYVLAVNANGAVSVCGNDWSHHTSVGNAFQTPLVDIWKSPSLRAFQLMMLEGRRCENKACADCYYLQIVPDNLDPFRGLLLQRWQALDPPGRPVAAKGALDHPSR